MLNINTDNLPDQHFPRRIAAMDALQFDHALQSQTQEILARCTNCGACAEICPMPAPAGLDTSNPQALTAGILAILRGGTHDQASRWADICSGSGHCIPACQHGVNPRLMLALARVATLETTTPATKRQTGFTRFGAMTKGVRVLSRLQLPPETLARFRADTDQDPEPEVVFYTGCNVMKTPHIVLLALDIMDAMGIRYRVMGGPSACCGVLQFGAGDITTSGRVAYRTIDRLTAAAPRALSWCPTCQIQLTEIAGIGRPELDMAPFVRFLAERLETLRPLLKHRVEKRVGLHEHPGNPGVPEAAQAILRAIPGLDFVDLDQPKVGYMCNKLTPMPALKQDLHRNQLQAAADAGVTTLAGIYHACHRELCSHERDWPFEVVNFLELVGQSMGRQRPDLFKQLKIMQDVDTILQDSMPLIEANNLDLEEARDVILRDLLGEQPLPLLR